MYNFDEIIDRKNNPQSFSLKWNGTDYILNSIGVKPTREDIICLETADMDFRCAPEICEDMKKIADHGIFGYSIIPPEYKSAVCHWYKTRQNWDISPDDIYYFAGTHEAISECVKRYTNPDDGVIVLTPCYDYHSDIDKNGRKYVCVDLINDGNEYFTVDYDALEKACLEPSNSMIVVCHPHNPTGRVFTCDELNKIAEICRRNNVLIVCDEVHSDILRQGQDFVPMMKACGAENLITCTAINKTFNVAGLAMTNVIISAPDLKSKMSDLFPLASPFGIQAVISAYTKGSRWVDELNEYIDENIRLWLDFLAEKMPRVKAARPEGGYSVNMDFSAYGLSGQEVAKRIYANAGVILNSGLFFDDKRGLQVHRACLASPHAMCMEALQRLYEQFES